MQREELLFIYLSSYNHISSSNIIAYLEEDTVSGKAGLKAQRVAELAGRSEFPDGAKKIVEYCNNQEITIITFLDPAYPEKLRNVGPSPPVLYVRGDSSLLEGFSGSVVGSRRPSLSGLRFCRELVSEMVSHGIPVISGFARGIDSCAHRAAIDGRGKTVAVLGSGVDVIYPRENQRLYSEVIEGGCVISRFPPGTPPVGKNFPVRNSIIAALSDFVCIVEAAKKSGSLITARFGVEYGKEIFAVPGNPLFPQSAGTNGLIKMGAHPLTGISDILESFGLSRIVKSAKDESVRDDLSGLERRVLGVLVGEMTADEIIASVKEDIKEVCAALVSLEIKDLLKRGEDGYYFKSASSR